MNISHDKPDGLWLALDGMESSACNILKRPLQEFHQAFELSYESGVDAPTLAKIDKTSSDLRLAALFLKRCLNDLRGVWILASTGYTSQSASVAAALYENALVVSAIAGAPQQIAALSNSENGDIPWQPQELSKMLARRWQHDALTKKEEFPDSEFEKAWREIYSAYKWLCRIKHPTIPSANHDASSTSIAEASYVVMAAPDVRDADIGVKALILTISLSRSIEAIGRFGKSVSGSAPEPRVAAFNARLEKARSATASAFKACTNKDIPFNIADSKIAKEWAAMKKHEGK